MNEQEMNKRIDSIASRLVQLRMESAVDFFLESHLPATTIMHNLGHFAQPLVTPFFGTERIAYMQEILSERKYVEQLQQVMREKAAERKN